MVEHIHTDSSAKVALNLSHAGRRGSTRPRWEGLDRPLRTGSWPLISASPIPYTPESQVPKEMDRAVMDRVVGEFVRASQMGHEAGFDMLQLNFAHGYLLGSFISPLTNQRGRLRRIGEETDAFSPGTIRRGAEGVARREADCGGTLRHGLGRWRI